MKRQRRTRILIEGRSDLLGRLAQSIVERYKITEIEAPNEGLVMVKMRETAKNSLFYVGELLVTEAKVSVNGVMGLGIVAGNKPEVAFRLAVVDAACNAALSETAEWESLLVAEEARLAKAEAGEAARILETRVSFDTMVDI